MPWTFRKRIGDTRGAFRAWLNVSKTGLSGSVRVFGVTHNVPLLDWSRAPGKPLVRRATRRKATTVDAPGSWLSWRHYHRSPTE